MNSQAHEKLLKCELMLPNIILYNQIFVETKEMRGDIKPDKNHCRLPNLAETKDEGLNEEYFMKQNKRYGMLKQRQCNAKRSLEFLNIVDNPPIEPKFLTRTEIREPHQRNQDICTRWLEHLARSIQEQINLDETRARPSTQSSHYEENSISDEDDVIDYERDLYILGRSSCSEFSEKEKSDILSKFDENELSSDRCRHCEDPLQKRFGDGYSCRREMMVDDSEFIRDCNEDIGEADLQTVDYLITRQIELTTRDKYRFAKQVRSAQIRKIANEYEISVDLRKSRNCTEGENIEKRSDEKKEVCHRFERRFKSAPAGKRSVANEEVLDTNKIRVYPFYEAQWQDRLGDLYINDDYDKCYDEGGTVLPNQNKSYVRLLRKEHRRPCSATEISALVKEDLKVSSVQLSSRNLKLKHEQTNKKHVSTTDEITRADNKVSKSCCSHRELNKKENCSKDFEFPETFLDSPNLNETNLKNIEATLELLTRVAAGARNLREEQLLSLIQNGNIIISKFLIIRKLLLTLQPRYLLRQDSKAILSIKMVLDFIDRCEKIYNESDLSVGGFGEGYLTSEIDCVKRGKVVGKMPPIEVKGFDREGKVKDKKMERTVVEEKKKIGFMTTKKLQTKKEIVEEPTEKNTISVTSLRRTILVSAMDLATNKLNKPYLLKQRYIPKRPKTNDTYQNESKEVNQLSVEIKKPIPKHTSRRSSQLPRKSSTLHHHKEFPERKISIKQKRKKDSAREKSFERISDEFKCTNPNCTDKHCETRSNAEEHSSKHRFTSYKISVGRRRSNTNKLCNFLRGKINARLQSNFELYQKVKKLLSSLDQTSNSKHDIKAAQEMTTAFIGHFKLIDPNRYEMYCKAFAKVDKMNEGLIPVELVKLAVRFVDSVASIPVKYIQYAIAVLDLDTMSKISIKMFCLVCGVLERMIAGGVVIEDAIATLDILMSAGKMNWYKNMFYESAEFDQNYITLETVKLELFAGGMSAEEERQISEKIVNKENHQISFLDFAAHIPLFIVIHGKICSSAFDFKTKFTNNKLKSKKL